MDYNPHRSNILLFFFFLIGNINVPIISKAQTTQSLRAIGGGGDDIKSSTTLDAQGNTYILGYFQNTVDFDPSPAIHNMTSIGQRDIFILKLDSAGNFQWVKRIGSQTNDEGGNVSVDGAGNIIISASYSSTIDVDPGPGIFTFTGNAGSFFLAKLDSAGNFIWAIKTLGAAMMADKSGNSFFSTSFSGTVDVDPGPGIYNLTATGLQDLAIYQIDSTGNLIWAKRIGGQDSAFISTRTVKLTRDKHILVSGKFEKTVDFDPGVNISNYTSSLYQNDFLAKFDSLGNLTWVRVWAGLENSYGLVFTSDNMENIYATNEFWNTIDFDPGPSTYNMTSSGDNDTYIFKLDSAGIFQWAFKLGNWTMQFGTGVTTDDSNNLYVTGASLGALDLDPGLGQSIYTPSTGNFGGYIAKYTPSGDYLWGKLLISNELIEPSGLHLDNMNNLRVIGNFWGASLNIESLSVLGNGGYADFFLLKIGQCSMAGAPTTITGDISPCISSTQIYTTPAVTGALYYAWSLPSGWIGTSVTDSITVSVGPGNGSITVTASDNCGPSTPYTINAASSPTPTPTIMQTGNTLVTGTFTSYQWQHFGSPINGATNQSYTPLSSGDYSVSVTDNNSCSGTSNALSFTTDLNDIRNEMAVIIYPNPTEGKATITSGEVIESILISDVTGKLIYANRLNSKSEQVEIPTPGVYFVKTYLRTKIITQKIVVH